MILYIQQTKTNFDMEWMVTDKTGALYAGCRAPFEQGRFQIGITYGDDTFQRLYYNPSDTTWGSKLVDRLSFKLFDAEKKIGHLVGKTQKTGFLKAYAYYEYLFNGETYYGYEVGFGSKGLYLCLYRGDRLIAIVDKVLRVVDYKDCYTAYIEREEDAKILLPFVLYYDSTAYGDVMEVRAKHVSVKFVNTIQKEVLAKYDPEFIPRIRQAEGLTD